MEKTIQAINPLEMTKEQLLSNDTFVAWGDMDDIECQKNKIAIRDRAKELGCLSDVKDLIKAWEKEYRRIDRINSSNTGTSSEGFPVLNEKGFPCSHWKNTEFVCQQLGIDFKYNEMSRETEVLNNDDFKKLTFDSQVTELKGVCVEKGYNLTKTETIDHMFRIAEKNKYHPVRDYLIQSCDKWDGGSRTRKLFEMFVLDETSNQDKEFIFKLFEKWLITAVKMAFNKGDDAAQGILVLIGPQGIGKTKSIMKILPDQSWGKDGMMIDTKNKDTIMQALSYFLVELGEYGRNLSAEKQDHYKAFITNNKDTFRAPYGRVAERHPRNTIFYATTDTDSFLRDAAGDRRSWCISIKGIKDIEIDIHQLWGEMMHRAFYLKEPHWLTKEEIDTLNGQNEAYKVRTEYFELLHSKFDWNAEKKHWLELTATDVCEILTIDRARNGKIGAALKQMEYLGVERKTKSNSSRVYVVPPFIDNFARSEAIAKSINHKKGQFKMV